MEILNVLYIKLGLYDYNKMRQGGPVVFLNKWPSCPEILFGSFGETQFHPVDTNILHQLAARRT